MKKNIKLIAGFVAAGAMVLATAGCGKFKDFGDTDVNPNGSAEVVTSALFTNVMANVGGIAASLNAGYYCQYFAEPTYPGAARYTLPQINSAGTYSGILQDCQIIINKNSDPATAAKVSASGDNQNQIAIARIMKAYIYWTLTDRWGDMPYSEALRGTGDLTPKYDEQKSIYEGILSELAAAKNQLNDAGGAVKGDIIYSGVNASWRKLANSLRMLIALRLSKRYPLASEYAAQQFSSAVNDAAGHITANSENFAIAYPGGAYRNPWFGNGGSADNAVAQTYTDLLVGLSDGRIAAHATSSNGVPYGLASAVPNVASMARILEASRRTEASTQVLVGASHVQLAKAEAYEMGWVSGKTTADAEVAYRDGITASFSQWGLAVPAGYFTGPATNYTTGNGVATIGGASVVGSTAATANKLDRIHLQQHIAWYPDGLQGWAEWRRTAMPNLKPTIFALNSSKQIIRRYVYGTTEYSLNLNELNIAIARMAGGDTQDGRVWWDKQ